MEKNCSQSYGSSGSCTKTKCLKRDQRVCWTAPPPAPRWLFQYIIVASHTRAPGLSRTAVTMHSTNMHRARRATSDQTVPGCWLKCGVLVAQLQKLFSCTHIPLIPVPAYAVTNSFFLLFHYSFLQSPQHAQTSHWLLTTQDIMTTTTANGNVVTCPVEDWQSLCLWQSITALPSPLKEMFNTKHLFGPG